MSVEEIINGLRDGVRYAEDIWEQPSGREDLRVVPLADAVAAVHAAADAAADARTTEIVAVLREMADESKPEAARAFVWFAAAEIARRFPNEVK